MQQTKHTKVRRGDIYYINFGDCSCPGLQGGYRPVLVVSNNTGNKHSPIFIGIPFTTKSKPKLPTHVCIKKRGSPLHQESTLLCEQMSTLSQVRLGDFIGVLPEEYNEKVNKAIAASLALA